MDLFHQPQGHSLAHGFLGHWAATALCLYRPRFFLGPARPGYGWRCCYEAAFLRLCRVWLCLWELGKQHSSFGSIFAFQVLPTIIFISAFFAVLYHVGIMQLLIRGFAWLMQWTLRVSGAESLNVAASIFMGQTEAPLTIRPFLPDATRSELMTIMTSGMAHVSGGIMAAYILYGIEAQHLLAAVIMTAPGTILVSKMLVPETEIPATEGTVHMPKDSEHKEENLLGAIARGTIDGGRLAFNV